MRRAAIGNKHRHRGCGSLPLHPTSSALKQGARLSVPNTAVKKMKALAKPVAKGLGARQVQPAARQPRRQAGVAAAQWSSSARPRPCPASFASTATAALLTARYGHWKTQQERRCHGKGDQRRVRPAAPPRTVAAAAAVAATAALTTSSSTASSLAAAFAAQPALVRDVACAAAAAVGALAWVGWWNAAAAKGLLRATLTRKLVHATSGPLFLLSWPLFRCVRRAVVAAAVVL